MPGRYCISMITSKRLAVALLLTVFLDSSLPAVEVKRPRILGVAHMALFVSDLQKARAFYKDFLGYDEPYVLKREDGADRIAFIKINENQYLELFAESPRQDGRLNHISFLTDAAEGMRVYLASRGVKVPDKVGKGRIGNLNFNIVDPDGHTVEIVQYQPDSWTTRERGKFMPETRISTHIMHIGVLIGALEPAMKFYGEILGFREFMGVRNHICLITPDIKKAVAILEARPARKNYNRPIEIKVGKNGKRQANLFDPDGTRIELMEPNTVDGKPVPPSIAPPPIK